mgnify:CR=1 FL=1
MKGAIGSNKAENNFAVFPNLQDSAEKSTVMKLQATSLNVRVKVYLGVSTKV